MSVTGIDQVPSRGGQTESNQSAVLGKDDFLNLLVAQLQAQDPMDPMDSTGFTAQLAQFSSLEQLQNINDNLGNMETSQSVMTNTQAVGFIGKTITAIGDSVYMTNGQCNPLRFNVNDDVSAVYLKIYDQQGNFVRDIECGAMSAGQHEATWDGFDFQGIPVPDGIYTYSAMAVDTMGNTVEATTYTNGLVTGVNFKNGQAYLLTENQEVLLGNVVQVMDAE